MGLGDTLPTIASVTAANTPGPINALIGGPNNSKSKYVCTLASSGTTLTGGSAPRVLKVSNFAGTATAQASVSLVNAVENLEGKIVLGPGSLWLPLYPAVGTSVLLVQSVTWEEIPA